MATFSPPVPSDSARAKLPLVVAQPSLGCGPLTNDVAGKIVLVERGNCSFVNKTHFATSAGAKGVVVVNYNNTATGMSGDLLESFPDDTPIPCVMIGNDSGSKIIQALSASYVEGVIFSPSRTFYPMFALWVMAVSTVIIGSIWAAPPSKRRSQAPPSTPQPPELETVEITSSAAVGFVIMASISLVVLFYFMSSLILFIIIIFCLGSSTALYQCSYCFFLHYVPCSRSSLWYSEIKFPLIGMVDVLSLALSIASLSICVTFFFIRNNPNAWFLQDVMGMAMCLMFLKTFRFPNVRVSAMLLVLAFFYDIFWVFLSPIFFHGQSVMVEVATGGGSGEAIPMLLKFPSFCEQCSPGLLGLGDIVLPGLFVSFTLAFDRMKGLPLTHGYFLYNAIGYGAGLLFTYIGLMYMEKGQPALLYLVPMTLGTTVGLACVRGHLPELWSGPRLSVQDGRQCLLSEDPPV